VKTSKIHAEYLMNETEFLIAPNGIYLLKLPKRNERCVLSYNQFLPTRPEFRIRNLYCVTQKGYFVFHYFDFNPILISKFKDKIKNYKMSI